MARKQKKSKKDWKKKDDEPKMKESANESSSKEKNEDSAGRIKSPLNDPAWYGRYPELLRDSSILMYSNPFGSKYRLVSRGSNILTSQFKLRDSTGAVKTMSLSGNIDTTSTTTPGIVSLYLWPTLGFARDREDPTNQMVNQLYTQVRYMNSGRKNYDPVDLTLYVLAIEELYSFIQWCKRLYGFGFIYSQQNMYIGEALLRANGVDPENMKQNLNDFRGWLNTFILHTSSYCIPKDMAYIAKKLFQYLGVYLENPYGNIKDQMYEFVPSGFLHFTLDSTNKGKLELMSLKPNPSTTFSFPNPAPISGQLMSVQDIIDFGNLLFRDIQFDEDFSLMSGDILKAFGASGIVVLDVQGEEGGVLPVYDPLVLSQFKNASISGSLNRDTNMTSRVEVIPGSGVYAGDIGQDANGNLISINVVPRGNDDPSGAALDNDFMHNAMGHILTVENPAPGPDDNMEATRLVTAGVAINGIIGKTRSLYCGTEIAILCSVTARKNDNWVNYNFSSNVVTFGDYLGNPGLVTALTAYVMSCKYAPRILIVYSDTNDVITEYVVDQNVDQFTVISWSEVQKMHRCALFSLLAVPTVARNINA